MDTCVKTILREKAEEILQEINKLWPLVRELKKPYADACEKLGRLERQREAINDFIWECEK